MSADALTTCGAQATYTLPGHCPLCGGPNRCRIETGEAYKGPCWCESPIVSTAAMRRLLSDLAEPRCVCATCLERIAANSEITQEALVARRNETPALALTHSLPIAGEGDFYWEGPSMVFTAQYHLRRGSCCGSGCRHCPYGS